MKDRFREYHQFSDAEFKKLWKDCLFVFDANTLLNMYRYSRDTFSSYVAVLDELKKQKKIWIPYQVGYEFHENRINVISEFEKSYDDILKMIESSKGEIKNKYKDHPFLDLSGIIKSIDKGLSDVEANINKKKNEHPKWMENDDVLEKINSIFLGSVGEAYSDKRIEEIKAEGENRYEKSVPPGFRDKSKPDHKKYGDLILWYQIIDKAKDIKKPVIFISGDVKEDWWLEKDGKRICPLPQLKKEMFDKAGVDFHIYTADRFLEYANASIKDANVDVKSIKEVKRIREITEERGQRRLEETRSKDFESLYRAQFLPKFLSLYERLFGIIMDVRQLAINLEYIKDLNFLTMTLRRAMHHARHNELSLSHFHDFALYHGEASSIVKRIIDNKEIESEVRIKLQISLANMDDLMRDLTRLSRHF